MKIPFACLTNGGGKLEKDKAKELNQIFEFNLSDQHSFQEKDLILNFTPLRPILKEFQTKPVLIIGNGEIERIAESCGLEKYITLDEYCSMYQEYVRMFKRNRPDQFQTRLNVMKRLGLQNQLQLISPLQLSAIFLLHVPEFWEDCLQIILDLMSSEDGKIKKKMPSKPLKQKIPIFMVNNDMLFADEFHLPRFAYGGPFHLILKEANSIFYGHQSTLDMQIYGKPMEKTYQYAEQHVKGNFSNVEISKFYMIGDNPESDIRGANQAKWISILVKSGVYKGQKLSNEDSANYIVEDFYEAVKLILKLEGINNTIF